MVNKSVRCRSSFCEAHRSLLCLTLVCLIGNGAAQGVRSDFQTWGVKPGYSLEVDSSGYYLPTAIAMIPEPGSEPDDPFYFVAELRGTIKVVTNSRAVHTFGSVPTWGRQEPSMSGDSQQGLAGLCLAPDRGLLFATYTEPDDTGVLRNHVAKFTSTPHTYSLAAHETSTIGLVLAQFQSAPAHQIGGCVVLGDELYIGVGDGGRSSSAGDPAELLGKVVCMDFDGAPCKDPPFPSDGPAAYTYAYGFRNPFGLVAVDGDLYAAENGVDLDRFLRISKGADHLWRGTDEGRASLAEIVFPRSMGPVQTAWVPGGLEFMDPDWSGNFVSAIYGTDEIPAGIIRYGGWDAVALNRTPAFLIESLSPPKSQYFIGVAVGPDGLYVVPMLPLTEDGGAVVKLRYDPAGPHPVLTSSQRGLFTPHGLIHLTSLGCTGCHNINGVGGGIGPSLTNFDITWNLSKRLNSPGFEETLMARSSDEPGAPSWLETAKREILAASDMDRVWVWLGYYLRDPRFAEPEVQMPDLDLSVAQIEAVRAELFATLRLRHTQPVPGLVQRVVTFVRGNLRAVAAGTALGVIGTLGFMTALVLVLRLIRRDRLLKRPTILTDSGSAPMGGVSRGRGRRPRE